MTNYVEAGVSPAPPVMGIVNTKPRVQILIVQCQIN
jgi:hypothetical protein